MKIYPDKFLGQNFLVDKNVLAKIITAAELKPSDTVLEIGAGTGILTAELAKRVKKVIAFEIDKKLIPALQENLKNFNNVEIIEEDILARPCEGAKRPKQSRSSTGSLPARHAFGKAMAGGRFARDVVLARRSNPVAIFESTGLLCHPGICLDSSQCRDTGARNVVNYKLVANIPYNITSAVLEKFLSAENKPSLMVLMVQREAAERVCAKPGEMSVLSVMAQYYGQPEIVAIVPASAFRPAPKVESAILKIKIRPRPHTVIKVPKNFDENFFYIVSHGFSRRRQMLKNNLRALSDEKKIVAAMRKAGIAEKARAQELGVEQWVDLVKKFDTHL